MKISTLAFTVVLAAVVASPLFGRTPASGAGEDGAPIEVALRKSTVMYHEGELTLYGRTWKFRLVDTNGNGRFNELVEVQTYGEGDHQRSLPGAGDLLYIQEAKDGEEGTLALVGVLRNRHYLSKLIYLDDRLFEIEVGEAGDRLTLKPFVNV